MEKYDVIVIGLGAMGSAAVYQLSKAGKKVLGIDQFNPPHAKGSSHGDTRITRLAIGEGAQYTPLVMRSHEIWREIERETARQIMTRTGGLIISSNRTIAKNHVGNFFSNTVEAARKYNIEHELLSAPDIRKRFPQFNVNDDEVGYFENEAGFIRPEEAISAQLELGVKYGAELHTDEKVEAYNATTHEVIVRTNKGEYRGSKLIIAAGSWLPELIEKPLGQYFTVIRQVLFWFEPNESSSSFAQSNFPIFIWEPQNTSQTIFGFPEIDSEGGVKIATEQYQTTTTPETVNRNVSEEETREMYKTYVKPNFPGLSDRVIKSVVCLYTVATDSGFVIDFHPKYQNIIIASPCSGHGFKHSAAIGEVLSQLAIDGSSKIDISEFSFKRFLNSGLSHRHK